MKRVFLGIVAIALSIAGTGWALGNSAAQPMSLPDLYEFTSPSVVLVEVVEQNNGDNPFSGGGLGSGFVYDLEGHIITNNHVVEDADQINLTFFDGTLARAEVVGTDPDSDLAVIKAQNVDPSHLRPVQLGDSSQVRVGEGVIAVGNPFGQTWTMTVGIISALGRATRAQTGFSIPMMIQTDAAINPGNSGGPLFNLSGEVLGVNTLIFSETNSSSGVGFAVPVNTVKRVVPDLIATGEYDYTWLGISGGDLSLDVLELLNLNQEVRGVLIANIQPNSPAEAAGLRGSDEVGEINGFTYDIGGDIVIAINGQPINGINELIAYLAENTRPGDVVQVTILRDGEEMTLEVTLEARPARAR